MKCPLACSFVFALALFLSPEVARSEDLGEEPSVLPVLQLYGVAKMQFYGLDKFLFKKPPVLETIIGADIGFVASVYADAPLLIGGVQVGVAYPLDQRWLDPAVIFAYKASAEDGKWYFVSEISARLNYRYIEVFSSYALWSGANTHTRTVVEVAFVYPPVGSYTDWSLFAGLSSDFRGTYPSGGILGGVRRKFGALVIVSFATRIRCFDRGGAELGCAANLNLAFDYFHSK